MGCKEEISHITRAKLGENMILTCFLMASMQIQKPLITKDSSINLEEKGKNGYPKTWLQTDVKDGACGLGDNSTLKRLLWFQEKNFQKICNLNIPSEAKSSTTSTVLIQEFLLLIRHVNLQVYQSLKYLVTQKCKIKLPMIMESQSKSLSQNNKSIS